MSKAEMRQVVAIAVLHRLHEWCVQLFWITILCVMGCCGDEKSTSDLKKSNSLYLTSSDNRRASIRHNLAEIELKVLRHLTAPQLIRGNRSSSRSSKRRPLSRPPSPQLFAIAEEQE
ncbi:unnamed protein product [Auanema sp. JU1783]|nr:unnamed protein product [Auanema sp. JU1783]